MLSPQSNAPEPEKDNDELSYEAVDQIISGKQSPDVAEHLELLDNVLADHLLETIQAGLANAKNTRGLLIEASLNFSPLFVNETPPALALFSYSSDTFKDDSVSINQLDLNVVEVHTFEPFDRVYQNAVDSIKKEGLFQTKKDLVFVIGGCTPGSGKETQCERIAKEFKLTYLSTGNLLRAEVATGSELGLFVNSLMKDGKIVPMNIIIELLKNAIEKDASSNSKGILIDDFPCFVDQAIEFERSVSSASFLLNFYCPLPILEARLLEPADDNLETIKKIFETFEEESLPVLEYFGDRVFTVDGGRDVDVLYDEVRGLIKQELLLEDKKVVIFAVSDGTCPEECHELCLRLSNQHNLTLTSFGGEPNFYGESEAADPVSGDAGEVAEVMVGVVPQHQQYDQLAVSLVPLRSGSSHSLRDAMSELDGELAEHLLETVRFHVDVNQQSENPAAGLLIEASFGFSPLFDNDSILDSEKPALALFSYPSDAFQDFHHSLPSFDDAKNVLEILKFQPFEKVYKSVKESVLKEGLLENSSVPIAFVLGGPGSGKGAQSVKLAAEFGLTHLSAGDLLREEVASGSQVGQLCSTIMKEGKIVPMEIIIDILGKAILNAKSTRGILIDGFPRAVAQAIEFERVVSRASAIINFTCPLQVLESRLLERGKTSGRADDNIETIRKRFKTFETESLPVMQYFGDRVLNIDGSVGIEEVYESVRRGIIESGIFRPAFNVIFAIGDGSFEDETHLLCTKLAEDYNLTLLNFGTPTYDDPTVEEEAQAFYASIHGSQHLDVLVEEEEGKLEEQVLVVEAESKEIQVKPRDIQNPILDLEEHGLETSTTSVQGDPEIEQIIQDIHSSIAEIGHADIAAATQEEGIASRIRSLDGELEEAKRDISKTAEHIVANFTVLVEERDSLVKGREVDAGVIRDLTNRLAVVVAEAGQEREADAIVIRDLSSMWKEAVAQAAQNREADAAAIRELARKVEVAVAQAAEEKGTDALAIRDLSNKLDETTAQAAQERLADSELIKQLTAKLDDVASQAADEIRGLLAENEALRVTVDEKTGAHSVLVETHERAVSGIQGDLQTALERAQEMQVKYDTQVIERDLLQTAVSVLRLDIEKERLIRRNEVATFEEERSGYLVRITALEAVLEESKTAHRNLTVEHKNLVNVHEDALDLHKSALVEHEITKATIENQILKLQTELIAAHEQHEHTVVGIKGDLHSALEQAQDVAVKHISVTEERNSLRFQLSALQTAKDQEQVELQSQITRLESELAGTKAECKALATQRQTLSIQQKDLWDLHKTSELEYSKSKASAENQILKLHAELRAVAAERTDALLDLAEADEDLKIAHAHISDLNDAIHMMKAHIARLTEQSRKSRTAMLEEHVVKLEKTIGSLKAEVKFLKSLIGSKR
ncbi:UNVERIFIED_CONTAM: hypothetical protein HDU68_011676 [Siphonaria sp. JEL0065]|nr:hypothetical protein HDU68_011676 [Siphonaria sp. JEL0065]